MKPPHITHDILFHGVLQIVYSRKEQTALPDARMRIGPPILAEADLTWVYIVEIGCRDYEIGLPKG